MKKLLFLILAIFLVSCISTDIEKCLCPECSGWEQIESADKVIKSSEDAAFQLSFFLEEDIKEEGLTEETIEVCGQNVEVFKSGQEGISKARAIDSKGRIFRYYHRE